MMKYSVNINEAIDYNAFNMLVRDLKEGNEIISQAVKNAEYGISVNDFS